MEVHNVNVLLIATKTCTHRPNLERELRDLSIEYRFVIGKDESETAQKYAIRRSPVLAVNDEVVFSGHPTAGKSATTSRGFKAETHRCDVKARLASPMGLPAQ